MWNNKREVALRHRSGKQRPTFEAFSPNCRTRKTNRSIAALVFRMPVSNQLRYRELLLLLVQKWTARNNFHRRHRCQFQCVRRRWHDRHRNPAYRHWRHRAHRRRRQASRNRSPPANRPTRSNLVPTKASPPRSADSSRHREDCPRRITSIRNSTNKTTLATTNARSKRPTSARTSAPSPAAASSKAITPATSSPTPVRPPSANACASTS
mmetsp:Transcript_753/g.1569  ORF Transcript_753/g.1569 Transcript_753/m.1569 type:complete len:210 (-) Transcript_753:300-929(-)